MNDTEKKSAAPKTWREWDVREKSHQDELRNEARRADRADAQVAELRGLVPELPPFPPAGVGLPRYGLRWNGPTQPLSVPMPDGYWTPWHLAARVREALQREVLLVAADRTFCTLCRTERHGPSEPATHPHEDSCPLKDATRD